MPNCENGKSSRFDPSKSITEESSQTLVKFEYNIVKWVLVLSENHNEIKRSIFLKSEGKGQEAISSLN